MSGSTEVLDLMAGYRGETRAALMHLRRLILETAQENPSIGALRETLKWGQPSYRPIKDRSGTTIRIDRDTSGQGGVALFVSCQSSLVSEWRALFPHLKFGGNRSVHFPLDQPLPETELRQMIAMALTYHSARRTSRKRQSLT